MDANREVRDSTKRNISFHDLKDALNRLSGGSQLEHRPALALVSNSPRKFPLCGDRTVIGSRGNSVADKRGAAAAQTMLTVDVRSGDGEHYDLEVDTDETFHRLEEQGLAALRHGLDGMQIVRPGGFHPNCSNISVTGLQRRVANIYPAYGDWA